MKITPIRFFLLFLIQWSFAQPTTVGLLYQDTNATEAYTLFSPQRNNEVYLVNNCGEKIKQWSFTELPGATCYLLQNGNLLRAGKDMIEIRDWNNNLIWSYGTTAHGINQHHDICPLPNGNILCLATETLTLAQITAEGRNPAITASNFKLDTIIELQPVGANDANIVWEWKFSDHLIQDFDVTKFNYGNVTNHPELIDINYDNSNASDFTHCNSIDYNPDLDQILISARHLSEIIIIDHSTTTAEAASHSGGNSNHGGDFLWRWGNPETYKQGTPADRKLFLQHDAKWVENDYLDRGKITAFCNGAPGSSQTYSSVVMIQPEIIGGVYIKSDNKFKPENYDWSWSGSILGITLNEAIMSGTHALPNGNMIISETSLGRVSEITKSGTVLWSYRNPTGAIVGGVPQIYSQFSDPAGQNAYFRAEKYLPDYAGFSGHDLRSVTGILENQNSVSQRCVDLSTKEFDSDTIFALNPARHEIVFNKSFEADSIAIYDMNGRLVYNTNSFFGDKIEVSLNPSVYILQIGQDGFTKTQKIVISR